MPEPTTTTFESVGSIESVFWELRRAVSECCTLVGVGVYRKELLVLWGLIKFPLLTNSKNPGDLAFYIEPRS